MRHLNRLPIWRDASRLLAETEQVVRTFARYHKYSIGAQSEQRQCGCARVFIGQYPASTVM